MFARNASWLALLVVLHTGAIATCQGQDLNLSRWIQQLRDPAPSYRLQAATHLGKLGGPAAPALPALFDRLQDIEPNVRLAAIQALSEIAAEPLETAKQLLPMLDDDDEHVRYAAEWAMAHIALANGSKDQGLELKPLFEKSLVRMKLRDHHERHRQVIEEAVQQLADRQQEAEAKAKSLAEELLRKERELQARKSELERELELARQAALDLQEEQLSRTTPADLQEIEQAFELSEAVDQLRIIYHLAVTQDQWPHDAIFKTRTNILKQAILRSEPSSVRFALDLWDDGQAAIMRLFDTLPSESNLPEWSIRVLRESRPRTAADVDKLAAILAFEENDILIRFAAAEALESSSIATPSSINKLRDVLRNPDEDLFLRSAVITPLVHLSHLDSELSNDLRSGNVRQTLMDLLCDAETTWSLRDNAASGLSKLSRPGEAFEAYLQAAREQDLHDYDLAAVVTTVAGFGANGASGGMEFVTRALRSSDDLTRYAAAEAIAKLGDSSRAMVPDLLTMQKNPYETAMVRLSAARALASIGPDAISEWAAGLLEVSDTAQIECLKALSRLGPSAAPALETCIRLIGDDSKSLPVRCAAISVVGAAQSNAAPVVTALYEFLRSDVPASAQATAIVALAQIDGRSVQDIETDEVAEEPITRVAISYAKALNRQGQGMDELVALLQGDATVYAAKALEDLGPPARTPLVTVLQDPRADEEHRLCAFEVLARIPTKDYRPLMSAVADHVIGERCKQKVYNLLIDGGTDLMTELVASLETQRDTESEARFMELTEAIVSGLGAGGEEDTIRLTSHLADGLLNDVTANVVTASSQTFERSASGMASYTPNEIYGSFTPHQSGGGFAPRAESYSADSGGGAGEFSPAPPRQENLEPKVAASDTTSADDDETALSSTPDSNAFQPPEADAGPEIVKVYYGTNRAPLALAAADQAKRLPKSPLAVVVAIAALAVCLFGFLRARARLYSLFAIAGLGCVAIIGLGRHLDKGDHDAPVKSTRVPYGSRYSDQLALGICKVSIPEGHQPGELESPSLHRLQFRQDAKKHVILESTTELNGTEFFNDMHQELAGRGSRLLVFIHGYNVSFEDAARRTAQMSHDLKFEGAPVFYSWPSQANWWEYQLDKKNVQLSVVQIKEFLLQLAEKSGATTINLVAHSMGNVGLTQALAEIDANAQSPFNQVVLAAPDIDADIFRTRIAPNIVGKAKRLTLYTSSNDLALVASRYFNAGRRVGDSSGPQASYYPGFDVIDASTADMSLLGHAYYGDSIGVLRDLGELLMDLPAQQRSFLRIAGANGQPYWIIDDPNLSPTMRASDPPVSLR